MTTLAVLASVAIPATAKAAVLNGGFEDGFNNWDTIGDVLVETAEFGTGPREGSAQAFLSTAYQEVIALDENFQPIIGGDAVIVPFISGTPNLEEFLGISTFLGDPSLGGNRVTGEPIEGSAIRQSFRAKGGQNLSFSWNFLTQEAVGDEANPDFNDFAFAILSINSQNTFFYLADTTSIFLSSGSNTRLLEETGFQKFSYTLPTDGEYTLSLGVVDVGEPTVISGLLVDKVAAVPETTPVLGMLLFGAVGTASVLKGKKRNKLTRI